MNGIWTSNYFNNYNLQNLLSLGEGNTPIDTLQLGDFQIDIKREDKNPSGSFKDRSIAFALTKYLNEDQHNFTISSSGNAGISLLNYSLKFDIASTVFFDNNLSLVKQNSLKKLIKRYTGIDVEIESGNIYTYSNTSSVFSDNPKSNAIKHANEKHSVNLRGSIDDNMKIGYESLGLELAIQNYKEIIILCSSGTAVCGIFDYYLKNKLNIPRFFIIQTPKVNPIIRYINPELVDKTPLTDSIVNCIVDSIGYRKYQVSDIIKKYNGKCIIIEDNDIINFKNKYGELLLKNELSSPNQIAPLAIADKINETEKLQKPIVIISGI